jgi:hypothetical protein
MNSDTFSRPLAVRLMRVAIGVLLLVGGLYYAWRTLPTAPLLQDPREVEALALVQKHPAIGFPSILEAMNEHVRAMKERGQGVRLGEWRVKQVDGTIYEIRVQLRDQSVRGQWFEREFIWHAHLDFKRVNAASLPADGVTPKAPDSDQRAVPSFPSPPAS